MLQNMHKVLSFLSKPLPLFLLFTFVVLSWPIINYPLTDGDIGNWTWVAKDVKETLRFFTGPNDQTHGPLLAWSAGLITLVLGESFYTYSLFNILCGVFATWFTYFFSMKLYQKPAIASLNTLISCTMLAPIYLARTPMYDWPAAIFTFAFCGFYYLSIKEKRKDYFWLAMLMVGIGSLARFSIAMGLAGIFMILLNFILKRPLLTLIRDGFVILFSCIGLNLPWLVGQTLTHPNEFLPKFMYDNVGRFIKSTRVDAKVRKDYYGFIIYALLGAIPYSFALLSSLFQKSIFKRIKSDQLLQIFLAGFLPCLLIFSFSGHTKLARYIAYIFPFLSLFIGHLLYHYDLNTQAYRKRLGKMILIFITLLLAALGIQIGLFPEEVGQSSLFVVGVIVLLFGLLLSTYWLFTRKSELLLNNAERALWPFLVIYLFFFSVLAFESDKAEFLKTPKEMIINSNLRVLENN